LDLRHSKYQEDGGNYIIRSFSLYSSPNSVKLIKSRMRRVGTVVTYVLVK